MVLKEVSGNAQPRHLNPYERAQIATLHDTGLSELSIQKFIDEQFSLKCSLATIHNTISLDPERIQGHTLQLGQDRKTTHEQDLKIADIAMSDPDQKVLQIAAKVNLSKHTVQRRLKEQGLQK